MANVEHSTLTSIHRFAYVSNSDPGGVGAYKAWVDTSVVPYRLKIRSAANTFWFDVGIYDQDLINIAALTPANDDVLQRKGGVWTNRTIAQLKDDLNLVIGTNVQAHSSVLDLFATLVSGADKLPYFTGAGTIGTTTLRGFGRSLLDDNTASDARTTLELGTMATQNKTAVQITGGSAILDFEALTLKSAGAGALLVSISALTADKALAVNVNNGNRTLSLSGNLTVSSTATVSGTNTGNELPSQTGNTNKVLITNGSAPLWYTGVLYSVDVASKTERFDLTGPKFIHARQDDNTLSYILATVPGGATSTDTDWVALPPAGRQTFKTFVTQSGTSVPTDTAVENGLQGTIGWARTGAGNYTITMVGAFAANKFFCDGGVWFTNGTDTILYSLTRVDNNSANLRVTKQTASTAAAIEISTVLSTYSLTSLPLKFYNYQ